jgi:hypothetical protein
VKRRGCGYRRAVVTLTSGRCASRPGKAPEFSTVGGNGAMVGIGARVHTRLGARGTTAATTGRRVNRTARGCFRGRATVRCGGVSAGRAATRQGVASRRRWEYRRGARGSRATTTEPNPMHVIENVSETGHRPRLQAEFVNAESLCGRQEGERRDIKTAAKNLNYGHVQSEAPKREESGCGPYAIQTDFGNGLIMRKFAAQQLQIDGSRDFVELLFLRKSYTLSHAIEEYLVLL